MPEENKLCNKSKKDANLSTVEMDNIYDNDPVVQTEMMSQVRTLTHTHV